jgi:hypothetical protein
MMDTRNFNLSGFKRIHIKFAMEAEIVRADEYSVSVSGSDTLIDNIEVFLEGDRLVLGYNLNLISLFAAPFTRARARITLPELRELKIVGAARCGLNGFNSQEEFTLLVAGASRLDMDEMASGSVKWDLSGASQIGGHLIVRDNMDIKVNGASKVKLTGSASRLDLDVSGASHFDLEGFPVHDARVRLVGASRGLVNSDGKLDVMLEGASNLEYLGQATLGDVRVSGASSIHRR